MTTILLGVYLLVGLSVSCILGAVFFEADEDDDIPTPLDGVTILKYAAAAFVGGVVWPVTVALWAGALIMDRDQR